MTGVLIFTLVDVDARLSVAGISVVASAVIATLLVGTGSVSVAHTLKSTFVDILASTVHLFVPGTAITFE